MEELDSNWISEYEKKELSYDNLYETKLDKIKIFSLYINSNCILDKVKRDDIFLKKTNLLPKKDLINLIKNKKKDDGLNYKLISLLSYNIDLKPNEINVYLNDLSKFEFYENIRELKDIEFKNTIKMFQDLNCIFFVFYEISKTHLKGNKTKKIYMNFSKTNHRKTKKNNLKDKQEIKQP